MYAEYLYNVGKYLFTHFTRLEKKKHNLVCYKDLEEWCHELVDCHKLLVEYVARVGENFKKASDQCQKTNLQHSKPKISAF